MSKILIYNLNNFKLIKEYHSDNEVQNILIYDNFLVLLDILGYIHFFDVYNKLDRLFISFINFNLSNILLIYNNQLISIDNYSNIYFYDIKIFHSLKYYKKISNNKLSKKIKVMENKLEKINTKDNGLVLINIKNIEKKLEKLENENNINKQENTDLKYKINNLENENKLLINKILTLENNSLEKNYLDNPLNLIPELSKIYDKICSVNIKYIKLNKELELSLNNKINQNKEIINNNINLIKIEYLRLQIKNNKKLEKNFSSKLKIMEKDNAKLINKIKILELEIKIIKEVNNKKNDKNNIKILNKKIKKENNYNKIVDNSEDINNIVYLSDFDNFNLIENFK